MAGRRHLRSADTMKLPAQRTRTVVGTQSVCSVCCCHLEQSTSRAGMDSRTQCSRPRPRPRPDNLEAKAKAKAKLPRGRVEA